MTVWYLIFAILLNTGKPAQTIAHPFNTQAECEAVGAGASADLVMNAEVDRAAWQCLEVDFSKADPKPAPKHVPTGREA